MGCNCGNLLLFYAVVRAKYRGNREMFSQLDFLVVLGGELAVPCTSNPLQLG